MPKKFVINDALGEKFKFAQSEVVAESYEEQGTRYVFKDKDGREVMAYSKEMVQSIRSIED